MTSELDGRSIIVTGAGRGIGAAIAADLAAKGARVAVADLDRVIMPGITHWQSPSFFAFFPANASGPSILGELASAGLGVQGMLWATSPACTELETHVLDWLVDLLGLPDSFRSRPRRDWCRPPPSRRRYASRASVATTSVSSMSTRRTPCAPRPWQRSSRPT